MAKPALIIIDMCQDFFTEGRLLEARPLLSRATNELASYFRKFGYPVIWVRQEFEPDLSDAFLSMRKNGTRVTIKGTPGAQMLPELNVQEVDIEIIKKRYSAFFGTNLDDVLREYGIRELVLAGVNTHACIRTAAVDGFQRDYEVILAEDAINSYDQQFHEESKRYLEGRVGTFLSNEAILQRYTK